MAGNTDQQQVVVVKDDHLIKVPSEGAPDLADVFSSDCWYRSSTIRQSGHFMPKMHLIKGLSLWSGHISLT